MTCACVFVWRQRGPKASRFDGVTDENVVFVADEEKTRGMYTVLDSSLIRSSPVQSISCIERGYKGYCCAVAGVLEEIDPCVSVCERVLAWIALQVRSFSSAVVPSALHSVVTQHSVITRQHEQVGQDGGRLGHLVLYQRTGVGQHGA
jgi:hypothetical protein